MNYKKHLLKLVEIINDHNTPAHSRIARVQLYLEKNGLNDIK